MPSLIQNALLLESMGNILGGLPFLLSPRFTLFLLVRDSSSLTPLSLTLWQMLGGITLALTVPLLAAYPDTPTGEAQRRSAYLTLGTGEGVIVPLLLAGWVKGTSPFGEGMVFGGSAVLAGAAAWRVWCLVVRPEVMAIDEVKKGQ